MITNFSAYNKCELNEVSNPLFVLSFPSSESSNDGVLDLETIADYFCKSQDYLYKCKEQYEDFSVHLYGRCNRYANISKGCEKVEESNYGSFYKAASKCVLSNGTLDENTSCIVKYKCADRYKNSLIRRVNSKCSLINGLAYNIDNTSLTGSIRSFVSSNLDEAARIKIFEIRNGTSYSFIGKYIGEEKIWDAYYLNSENAVKDFGRIFDKKIRESYDKVLVFSKEIDERHCSFIDINSKSNKSDSDNITILIASFSSLVLLMLICSPFITFFIVNTVTYLKSKNNNVSLSYKDIYNRSISNILCKKSDIRFTALSDQEIDL